MEGQVNSDFLNRWKRKRQMTYVVFLMCNVCIGIEISGCISTLWIYVSKVMKTNNNALYYGLINAAPYFFTVLFLNVVARWVDTYRRVKFVIISANILSMIGCVLYILPFSPLIVLLGRFLMGANMITMSLTIGEIGRSYNSKDIVTRISLLSASRVFGFALGPLISVVFINKEFWIGKIHITYANVIGLELLLLLGILQIFISICVFDLSKEFDYKLHLLKQTINNKNINIQPWKVVVKNAFKNFDTALLLFLSFSFGCIEISFTRGIPVLIIEELKFPYSILNWFVLFNNIFTFLLLAMIGKLKLGIGKIFYLSIVSMVSLFVLLNSFLGASLISTEYKVVIYILLFILAISVSAYIIGERVFVQVMCAHFAKPCHQSFFESMRSLAQQIGCMLGSLYSVILVRYFVRVSYPVYLTVCLMFFVVIIARKSKLQNPTPLI